MTIRSIGWERSAWCSALQSATAVSSSSVVRTARSRASEAGGRRAATCTYWNASEEGGRRDNVVHKRRKTDVVARHAPCRPSSAAAETKSLRDRPHAPEVPRVASFPRSTLARARHTLPRRVLGSHRAGGDVTASDQAGARQCGSLHGWDAHEQRQVLTALITEAPQCCGASVIRALRAREAVRG